MRCPYPLYYSTALRMHTKHCLLCTHACIHSLTWLAMPAIPYYSHSCLLQDYASSTLVSTTLACPVVWSWVGNITAMSLEKKAQVETSSNMLVPCLFSFTKNCFSSFIHRLSCAFDPEKKRGPHVTGFAGLRVLDQRSEISKIDRQP